MATDNVLLVEIWGLVPNIKKWANKVAAAAGVRLVCRPEQDVDKEIPTWTRVFHIGGPEAHALAVKKGRELVDSHLKKAEIIGNKFYDYPSSPDPGTPE
jgi:hypothetical protein